MAAPTGGGAPAGEIESRGAGGAGEAAGVRELGGGAGGPPREGRSSVLPNAAASVFLPSGGRVLPNGISSG